MTEPAEPERTTSLLFQLLGLLSRYAVQWLAVLRRDYLLSAFLLLSFICFNAMIVLNVLRHPFVPWRALPVFLPVIWVFFYGGVFVAMVFAAHTSPDREAAVARRPRAELVALLAYLGFMFLAVYLRAHGNGHSLPGRALGGMIAALDHVDRQALDALGIAVSHQALIVLRNSHFFLVFPLIGLLLSGNGLRALGFRAPLSKPWTAFVWLALPLANFALLPTSLGRGALALAAAVCGPGLAEELTFRVGLQSRLELALRSPIRAIMASSLFFALIHLAAVETGQLWAPVNALGLKMMVGFLLGYLWYRTRSLLPVVLLHGTLDVAFFAGGG